MNILILILSLTFVTFIPRLLPAIFVGRIEFPPKVEKFLNLIPYTALAALICPGVLTVDSQYWFVGLVGAIVAGILAWKKMHIGLIVVITVIALVTLYLFIPFIICLF